MFHLGSAKIAAAISRTFFWKSLKADTRKILSDCPECELEKARQKSAHGLFSARPHDAPRARYAMDFQGMGTAVTGETQALGIIDTTARYAIVIPLADREATTFIQPFLDNLVFVHGPPDILHSDAAQEFLSEAMQLLANATDTHTTTTLGHNAKANGTIEIFWRYWNRALRILSDDHYLQWPAFASRICYAYNTAAHESLGNVSPYEIYFGCPARDPFTSAAQDRALDDELPALDLADPAELATAVRESAAAFSALARHHTDYVRSTTAERLNQFGHPKTYAIDDKVKIRLPPSHEEMVRTGRRSSHLASWRGPCTITTRISSTAYAMTEDATGRKFERVSSNILPYRATSVRRHADYDPVYSDPFVIGEIIAVRDEPASPFYLASVLAISAISIQVHYLGCTQADISRSVFRFCWHTILSNIIVLSDQQPARHVHYTGSINNDSLRNLLVARNLELTATRKLRKKSQRAIANVHDELFIFDV